MNKNTFDKVGHMSTLLFLITIMLFASDAGAAKRKTTTGITQKETKAVENTFKTPDFAFPETVGNNADVALKEALASGNDVMALKAAIQLVVSRNLISKDNYKESITLFSDLAGKLKAPYSQLATMLEAQLYSSIYETTPGVFNNRSLPLTPVPENVMEWSRDIFAAKVTSLISDAFRDVEVARATPLSAISTLIENGKDAEKMGMSVYDFMTIKTGDLLQRFSNNDGASIIPFGYGGAAGNKKSEKSASALLSDITDSCIAWHQQRGDTQIAAALSYYKYQRMPWRDRNDYASECVKRYIDTPYCAAFILAGADFIEEEEYADDNFNTLSPQKQLEKSNLALKKRYQLIESYLKKFPQCDNAQALKNRLTVLGAEDISVSTSGRIYPAEKGKIKVSASNVFNFNLLVVKLPDSYINKDIRLNAVNGIGNVVGVIPVSFTGEKPVKCETEVELPALQSGVYVLVPSSTAKLSGVITGTAPKMSVSPFTVSRLAYFRSCDQLTKEGDRLYVVDGRNQKPVSGAKVVFTSRSNKQNIERVSGDEGFVIVPNGSYDFIISKGTDRLAGNLWSWGYGGNVSEQQINGKILTDLSIYRPGDTLGFMGIVYTVKDRRMQQLSDAKVRMLLCDANYQAVDTLHLVSDSFGRVKGKFTIPQSGLLGNYVVRMMNESGDSREYASTAVEVADYKSPTFFVTTDGTEDNYKIGDVVKIKGKASIYSGMPVAGAVVKYDVRYISLRWLNSNINANYGGETTTAADGSFTIELPTEGLRDSKYAFGGYELNISVTSQSGETQEAPATWFSLGQAYSISATIPSKIAASMGEKNYAVRVMDIVGNPVKRTVYYRISEYENEGNIVKTGEFESPVFSFDAASLKSGRYKIKFSLDSNFKDEKYSQPASSIVTVYRRDDKIPPYTTPLWTPEDRIVASKDAKDVKIKVGSSYSDSWIFAQIADCDKVIDRRWLHVNAGMTEISVPVPGDNNRVEVTFAGTHDFGQNMTTVTVIPQVQTENIKIKTQTFRDRIAPGARESWKFNFTLDNAALGGIPVAAVMSNKALNALMPFQWTFNPIGNMGYGVKGNFQWGYTNHGGNWRLPLSKVVYGGITRFDYPSWDMYGLQLYGAEWMLRNLRIRGAKSKESLNSLVLTSRAVTDEVKLEDADGAVSENEVFYSVEQAPMFTGAVAQESAMGSGALERQPEPVMRQVDCPLAFFMPEMITDANGDAVVDFTVPQFNGTWQFQIMGYTEDMKGGVSVMDAVASKPVMAQMNAPRFVRTGDEVSVAAMLYNNSTEEMPLYGKIEIFDPASGNVIKTFASAKENVEPAGSTKISTNFSVPGDINYIGIRVYAYGGDFADGEQTVIPVYPSSTPVIESKPFYIAPGQDDFSMKIPSFGKGAKVTLQYNDNPIWDVVTALPDISEPKSSNILSQVYSLYGNAIGAGLAKDYPEIVEAIKIFADPANSVDSTLVSNLEKNQDLKNVALNNTPWVRSAASETLRMQGLVKYADSARSKEIIASTLKEMAKLQNADGGWSWCAGMESSEFITSRVLLHLAMLRDMGYLPAEGETMAKKAVKYADACWVKELKEYKGSKFPYESMLNYLYVRSNFKDVTPSASFASMEKKGLAAVKDGWKRMGIYEKATAATLLGRKGFNMESRTILESLRQYASVSQEKGMWFDNLSSSFGGWNKLITTAQVLEAYSEIEPKSENVDKLRQWLLITKQTENWGDDRETAEVIHAILASGTKWTVPSSPAEIMIDGERVNIDRFAALTGSVTVNVDANGKGNLTIRRTGAGPAWGGLISQYVAPIKDVKSAKVAELSIEKNIYVITNDADGTTASAGTLKVGDKVRVTLTVSCDRDLEYVAVMDARAACLEPADQISGYTQSDGVWMYREVRDNSTNLFIPFLGKGTHVISYDCYVDREGDYSLGIASAQSQYAPVISAHSAGKTIVINN